MRPLKSVLIHSVGWHLSELLDLIPTPIDHSGSVTGKVPERVTEKEKKISELLVEAPEAIIIIFKPAGLSDHVSSIYLSSVDSWNKEELLQIFSQTTDRTGILRFCKYDHSFQLIPVFLLQFCNGTAHGIE